MNAPNHTDVEQLGDAVGVLAKHMHGSPDACALIRHDTDGTRYRVGVYVGDLLRPFAAATGTSATDALRNLRKALLDRMEQAGYVAAEMRKYVVSDRRVADLARAYVTARRLWEDGCIRSKTYDPARDGPMFEFACAGHHARVQHDKVYQSLCAAVDQESVCDTDAATTTLHRTLVRVEQVLADGVVVVVPAWSPHGLVHVADAPAWTRTHPLPYRCHARVNLGAEAASDLRFEAWEEHEKSRNDAAMTAATATGDPA